MNSCFKFILCLMFLTSVASAKEIYPKQPKLRAAHHALVAAKEHLQRGLNGKTDKHFQEATISLSSAQSSLENAMKNKGSSRLAAIREIKAALDEIAPAKGAARSASEAIQHIENAIKEVAEAARAAR